MLPPVGWHGRWVGLRPASPRSLPTPFFAPLPSLQEKDQLSGQRPNPRRADPKIRSSSPRLHFVCYSPFRVRHA